MKAHTTSAISSLILITMSAWGYLASETPSFTALIPLIFGLVILALYKGVKAENKVIAHIAVLLTLVVLIALFMPLKGAMKRDDNQAIFRIVVMMIGAAVSMVAFIQSFRAARKAREKSDV